MLKSLTLENFKGFGAAQTIPFAPVTLLYGPNSGGKSSIIQALLLLKQSHEEVPEFALELQGKHTDLGNLKSVTHRHEHRRALRVGIEWSVNEGTRRSLDPWFSEEFRCEHEALGGLLSYQIRVERTPPRSASATRVPLARVAIAAERAAAAGELPGSAPWSLQRVGNDVPDVRPFAVGLVPTSREHAELESVDDRVLPPVDAAWWRMHVKESSSVVQTRRKVSRLRAIVEDLMHCISLNAISGPMQDYDYLEAMWGDERRGVAFTDVPGVAIEAALEREAELSLRLAVFFHHYRSVLRSITHLGPFREMPERVYKHRYPLGAVPWDVNPWLEFLEVPYRVNILALEEGPGMVGTAVQVRDLITGTKLYVRDVGFGVSQLLPILMAAQGMGVVCVEQPELHLHPRLQAGLADLFLATALDKERDRFVTVPGASLSPVQWIVETHSEAIMLRIQRRIREGKCPASDVNVLYVEPSKSGTRVTRLRLDDRGEFIDEWPGGFFEQSLADVVPIRDWAERRKRGK